MAKALNAALESCGNPKTVAEAIEGAGISLEAFSGMMASKMPNLIFP